MRFTLGVLGLFSAVALLAQEPVSFSDFIAEDGSGIAKLKKFQDIRGDKKEVYTTHDTVRDLWEQVELVTVLLDEAVMQKVRKLPAEQGMELLKTHLMWCKYFKATPSLPDISGSASGIFSLAGDFIRIKNRWEGVKLPYEQYLVYEKIANLCQVRLDCGNCKMQFGEVCLKKEACWASDADEVARCGKYYHDFPIGMQPESCVKIPGGYAAILHAHPMQYLCVWNSDGVPTAVHTLKTLKKVTTVSVDNGQIKVSGKDHSDAQKTESFSVAERNTAKISTEKNK